MTLSSLESASFWANVAVVVLGVLAALAAGFALYFSSRSGGMKDAELERFQNESRTQIATANARVAEANESAGRLENANLTLRSQLATTELQLERVRLRLQPRKVDFRRFAAALKKSAEKGSVQVLWVPDDTEVYEFADQIMAGVQLGEWSALNISQVIPPGAMLKSYREFANITTTLFTPAMRMGGEVRGVTILVHRFPNPRDNPALFALVEALKPFGEPSIRHEPLEFPDQATIDLWRTVPFIVVVGPKP